MANAFYNSYLESCLSYSPSTDLDTDTIKVRLVDTSVDYTFSAAHDFADDVTAYSGTTDYTLAGKTVTAGVFDDTGTASWTAVAIDAAKTADALVIYKDTGTPGTSPLICYIDDFTAVTPNGSDIEITWNASGIFTL